VRPSQSESLPFGGGGIIVFGTVAVEADTGTHRCPNAPMRQNREHVPIPLERNLL
jgi:hypothetical protein